MCQVSYLGVKNSKQLRWFSIVLTLKNPLQTSHGIAIYQGHQGRHTRGMDANLYGDVPSVS
jgi:hypothetical protein